MLALPIGTRSTGLSLSLYDAPGPIGLGRGTQTFHIDPNVLKASLREVDAQYLHLSSSACLRGMSDTTLPPELRGCLLPVGKLDHYGLKPASGEGGGSEDSLKWHAISVCSTVDINGSLGTLAAYAGTEGFIHEGDFPVLFAIHNPGEITSDPDHPTVTVIDPLGKMDPEEFAIRGIIDADSIRAIYVPAGNENDAWQLLTGLPALQGKLNTTVGN